MNNDYKNKQINMGESVISEYVSIDDYSGRNSPDDIALNVKHKDKVLEKDL